MSNLVNNNSCLSRAHVLFFMTVGVNSDDLIGGDIVGSVSRGFDKIFDLFRSVRNVSVVMFCATDIGILVNSCIVPVLLAVNPKG